MRNHVRGHQVLSARGGAGRITKLGGSLAAGAVLVTSLGTFIAPPTADAAPAASPACTPGYGVAGTGGDGQASTEGGPGCVVIEYVVGGETFFETFNYTGALQSWVVPVGAETAKFITYGAGGGGTNTLPKRTSGLDNYREAVDDSNSLSWYSGNAGEAPLPEARNGGAGGSASGTFVVTSGESFTVLVGQGGIGNADDRCLPVVTRIGPANGNGEDLTRRDDSGNINLWPLNGVPSNTDPNARQGFGGGGRASAFHNTRAFFPIRTTNDLGRDHDECINPYYAAGGGRSEVLRESTRLVGAGGGGGAGYFGAGGAGATLTFGNASATGGDGAGPPYITNHPDPITVSPTYGSGGTGSAGGARGLTADVLDNYVGSPTFTPWTLFRSDGVAGSAGIGGQAPQGGGGGGGGCFGGGGGGDGGGGGGGSSCLLGNSVLNFTTTSPDGTYGAGDSINITANMTKPIEDGAQITVTLDTGETVLLTKTGPNTMSGTYIVGAGVTTDDLTVGSYTLTTPPVDADGITMTSTTVPSGSNNIAGSHAIVIAETSPPPPPPPGGGGSPGPVSPPVAEPDQGVGRPGEPVTVDPIGNDDAVGGGFDGSSLRLCPVGTQPPNCDATSVVTPEGTWVIDPSTGAVTFTPVPGFTGPAEMSYQVATNSGQRADSVITIWITDVPSASDDYPRGDVDQPLTMAPLVNDAHDAAPWDAATLRLCGDGQSPPLCDALLVETPEGVYQVNPDGTVTFTPAPGFIGTATPVRYQVADVAGQVGDAWLRPTVRVGTADKGWLRVTKSIAGNEHRTGAVRIVVVCEDGDNKMRRVLRVSANDVRKSWRIAVPAGMRCQVEEKAHGAPRVRPVRPTWQGNFWPVSQAPNLVVGNSAAVGAGTSVQGLTMSTTPSCRIQGGRLQAVSAGACVVTWRLPDAQVTTKTRWSVSTSVTKRTGAGTTSDSFLIQSGEGVRVRFHNAYRAADQVTTRTVYVSDACRPLATKIWPGLAPVMVGCWPTK